MARNSGSFSVGPLTAVPLFLCSYAGYSSSFGWPLGQSGQPRLSAGPFPALTDRAQGSGVNSSQNAQWCAWRIWETSVAWLSAPTVSDIT